MNISDNTTALHEAGHGVLHVVLGIGCDRVTIVAGDDSAGASFHGGEWSDDEDVETLRTFAEDSFWLRHAIAAYAGAEALRHAGVADFEAGAGDDLRNAADAINRITGDAESIDLLFKLAKRRCAVLVAHYWPEIELVAKGLAEAQSLSGDQVREIVSTSMLGRRARRLMF